MTPAAHRMRFDSHVCYGTFLGLDVMSGPPRDMVIYTVRPCRCSCSLQVDRPHTIQSELMGPPTTWTKLLQLAGPHTRTVRVYAGLHQAAGCEQGPVLAGKVCQ